MRRELQKQPKLPFGSTRVLNEDLIKDTGHGEAVATEVHLGDTVILEATEDTTKIIDGIIMKTEETTLKTEGVVPIEVETRLIWLKDQITMPINQRHSPTNNTMNTKEI